MHERGSHLFGGLQQTTLIDLNLIDPVLDIVLELPIFELLFCRSLARHVFLDLNRGENDILVVHLILENIFELLVSLHARCCALTFGRLIGLVKLVFVLLATVIDEEILIVLSVFHVSGSSLWQLSRRLLLVNTIRRIRLIYGI